MKDHHNHRIIAHLLGSAWYLHNLSGFFRFLHILYMFHIVPGGCRALGASCRTLHLDELHLRGPRNANFYAVAECLQSAFCVEL